MNKQSVLKLVSGILTILATAYEASAQAEVVIFPGSRIQVSVENYTS